MDAPSRPEAKILTKDEISSATFQEERLKVFAHLLLLENEEELRKRIKITPEMVKSSGLTDDEIRAMFAAKLLPVADEHHSWDNRPRVVNRTTEEKKEAELVVAINHALAPASEAAEKKSTSLTTDQKIKSEVEVDGCHVSAPEMTSVSFQRNQKPKPMLRLMAPGAKSSHCPFCRIQEADPKNQILPGQTHSLAGGSFLAIRKPYISKNVNFLVISKSHIQNLKNDEGDRQIDLNELTDFINKLSGGRDWSMKINNGKNAGQEVFHFHAHISSDDKPETWGI